MEMPILTPLYLGHYSGTRGCELWTTNGTAEGTILVQNMKRLKVKAVGPELVEWGEGLK